MNELPAELATSVNLHILKTIADRSAHSDVIQPLTEATRHLPGVKAYTPDGRSFKYLIIYSEGIIFALADGMRGPTLRLPARLAADEIALGAVPRPEYGNEWVMFPLFQRKHRPLVVLVRAAFEHVARSAE